VAQAKNAAALGSRAIFVYRSAQSVKYVAFNMYAACALLSLRLAHQLRPHLLYSHKRAKNGFWLQRTHRTPKK